MIEALLAILFGSAFSFAQSGLNEGLVSWYPLNMTVEDYSGNGNHPTTSTSRTMWTRGHCNSTQSDCLLFAGNTYLRISQAFVDRTDSFSYSFWANINSVPAVVLDNGSEFDWFFQLDQQQAIINISGQTFSCDLPSITLYSWHHYAFIHDRSTLSSSIHFYFDGIGLCQKLSPSFGKASREFIYIGYCIRSARYMTGNIQDFRFYNRTLNATEIQQLMACPNSSEYHPPSSLSVSSKYDTSNNGQSSSIKTQEEIIVILTFDDNIVINITELEKEISSLIGYQVTVIETATKNVFEVVILNSVLADTLITKINQCMNSSN